MYMYVYIYILSQGVYLGLAGVIMSPRGNDKRYESKLGGLPLNMAHTVDGRNPA